MTPELALRLIAISATAAPDPRDRAIGLVLIATQIGVRGPAGVVVWWQWTSWVACGITIARIEGRWSSDLRRRV